jgi:hypothetical protein
VSCTTLIIITRFPEIFLMPILDALKAFWILGVFLLTFFWLPTHLSSGRPNSPRVTRIAGNWARTVLCVTILVFLLCSLKVFGAITVVLSFLCAIAVGWFRKRGGMPRGLWSSLQTATINIIRMVESRSFELFLLARKPSSPSGRRSWGLRVNELLRVLEGKELLSACFVVVLGTTVVLRTEHAVRELRFDQPEQYSALLRARELMLNIHPAGRPFVFPAMIAATSLLSGTDPMQVTRFVTPAIGLLVVLATGLLIQVCARGGIACFAAIYCLGAAEFPAARDQTGVAMSAMEKIASVFNGSPATIRARPEFALGLLFFLLALVFLGDWYRKLRGWDSLLDFTCCLLLTGIISQVLLIVLMMTAAVLLLRPMAGLFAFVMLCYGLIACATLSTRIIVSDEMRTILPVAAAILVGCLLALLEARLIARAGSKAEAVLLVACLCVALIWFRPQRVLGRCLEYEAAARATQEIAYRFPRQTWVVAAPVEQLAETFGLGGHEDLAGFVAKYRSQVSSPEFRFPDARENLFIYVEKKPFQIFSREPETVSFSALTDPTYRNYRSPGGRASLEAAALQLCENYRQYHSNADVFFENEVLRIYHIHPQQASETEAGQ